MAAPIEFWFDFSSPYGYLAAQRIEALAARHGRTVDWRPMLLGVAFKVAGTAPLTEIPLKGEYSKRDFARSARFHGVGDFRMPSRFPIATQAASRILLWAKSRDPGSAARVAKALFRAYWVDDRDISNADVAAEVAGEAGVDAAAARAVVDDPAWKDALKREVETGLARGVFGSPFVIVDGEPFWGLDRFDQIDWFLGSAATKEGRVRAVSHLRLVVADLPACIAFYRDVLGLPHLFTVPGQAMAFFMAGSVRLYLGVPEDESFRSRPVIYYGVDDLQAEFAGVVERGATVLSPPHPVHRDAAAELWMAFVADPDGTPIGLMAERPVHAVGGG